MANVFDQFDAAPAAGSAPPARNVFDQFDPPARAPRPRNEPGMTANPFEQDGEAPASFNERFGPGTVGRQEGEGKLYEGLRRQADERLIGEPSAGNAALAGGLRFSNSLGLNLPRNAAAGLATAAGKVGIPGFNPDFEQNYQLAKDQEAALGRQNPKSALAGDVAGIGAGMVVLPAWGGASTLARRAGQAAVTGAGYGAASEFADTKDLGHAAIGGAIGGAGGLILTPALEKGIGVIAGLSAKGLPYRDKLGELTTTAKTFLKRAGVDPAAIDKNLDEAIEAAFSRKGPSEAAAREAAAGEFGIPLTKGQTTQDAAQLRLEQELAAGQRGTKARDAANSFFEEQRGAIDTARAGIGERFGGEARVSSPLEAGELVAGRLRGAVDDAGSLEARALAEADAALGRVRGGDAGDAIDAASTVAQGVRDRAAQAKGAYREAYGEVGKIDGEFAPGALDRLGTTVRYSLPPDVPVDEVLTPAATRALADLDNLPGLFKTEPGAGPNPQQVELIRKRLVSYRKSAANDTDRRAMDHVLGLVDDHIEAAEGAGLFGPRSAMRAPVDDFPGNAALDTMPAAGGAPTGRERAPETLTQFLGREGGIALDGDARAGDLQRVMTGYGPLARRNGRSLDDLRPRLIEEGFLPPDADGGFARNVGDEVFELIRRERAGEPAYRIQDRDRGAAVANRRAGGADDHFADLVEREAQRITADHEAVGLRARDLDPAALREASESLVHGRHSDPFEAYEAAVMARGAGGKTETVSDIPFDGATAPATSSALPGGSTELTDAMRKARGAFASYQRTFKPQGTGDDVGRAIQRIVEQDASAGDVARMLYGAGKIGNTKLQVGLVDRLKGVLGPDDPAWAGLQQGLITKIIGTPGADHAAVSRNIQDALTGPSRQFTLKLLSHEQVEGLRAFQKATETARQVREAVPPWVRDLGKEGFDPQRVVDSLFGRTTTTANTVQRQYADGIKKLFGEGSPEWAGLRQAGWQKLTGEGGMSPKEMGLRIRDFTNGKGKAVARMLYSDAELATMNRFASQLQAAAAPDGAKGLSKDETMRQVIARKAPQAALNAVLGAIGYGVGGPMAAGTAMGANIGRKLLEDARNVRLVREFAKGAPQVRPPMPTFDAKRAGVGWGLVADEAY